MSNNLDSVLRFGVFEADLRSGELRKNGRPVRLQPQPFRVLTLLLERPGKLVTREEIQQALWGGDTFVDFEQGLNFAVKEIRRALGDDAERPRYVETLPRRGYRFIAPIEHLDALPIHSQRLGEAPSRRTEGARPGEVVSAWAGWGSVSEPVQLQNAPLSVLAGAAPPELDVPPANPRRTPVPVSLPAPNVRPPRSRLLIPIIAGAVALVSASALWVLSGPNSSPKVLRSIQLTHSGRAQPHGRVLTDGNRLYFSERAGGNLTLVQVPLSGGDSTAVPTSSLNAQILDIDPSGANLLFAVPSTHFEDPLWVMPAAGGSVRRLGDTLATDAAWSPDGRWVVYGRASGAILVVPADGGAPRKLLQTDGLPLGLRWSPDSGAICFSLRENRTGNTSLWVMGADGSSPHRLFQDWQTTAHAELPSAPVWSPDGRYLVFRSKPDGPSTLWAVRVQEGWFRKGLDSPVRLYTSPDQIGPPSFSRDGKKLYFVNFQPRRELTRYDRKVKQFVPYLSGVPARFLSFSRDGQWVAYRRDTDGTLWRSRTDGTERLQLTFPPMNVYGPSWPPEGDRIAFAALTPDGISTLYTVSTQGGPITVVASARPDGADPSWSPDGRLLLFRRWDPSSNARGSEGDLYVLDGSNRGARKLPGSEKFPDGFKGAQWSPDGHYVAAVEQSSKLLLFDFTTGHWSLLTTGADIYAIGIRWSADSQYVYYQDVQQGEEQPILRVGIRDRKVERVASSRQILSADLLSYTMTGLAPDGSPVASLLLSTSDVYSLELNLP